MPEVAVAVLATLNSKREEARFVSEALSRAGVRPLVVDLSLRPHGVEGASVTGGELAGSAGYSWSDLADMNRADAAEAMIEGGRRVLLAKYRAGDFMGVIGLGGANGSSMACSLMRSLPLQFTKVMFTPLAATAPLQRFLA